MVQQPIFLVGNHVSGAFINPWESRMEQSDLTARVRETALANGAALVGFAPISRFDNAPPEYNPRTIFPQTRTAIAVAVLQPRGTLKAVEEGCYWQSYNSDSYWYLNEVLAPQLLRAIVMLLEEHGYTSVPVHNPFHPHSGRQIRPDMPHGPEGMLSLRVMGVAAGLGELGMSKVFLTPQYGPRQRVFAVLTDAELQATPLFEGKVCDECRQCVRECEAKAIGDERSVTFTIEDRQFGHAPLDCAACGVVHRGDDPRYSPFWNGSEAEGAKPSFNTWIYSRFRHLSVCVGRGCLRSCLDHLEKTGRIEKTFSTPLIQGKRWKLSSPPEKQPRT
jgi:epoxyqueuosine reductase